MSYFNYHAKAKRLINDKKLIGYYFTQKYKNISPALLLFFDDIVHPIMPIRKERFYEYLPLLESETLLSEKSVQNLLSNK